MKLCRSSKYQNITFVNIITNFTRKNLSIMRLKFYHWQQILLGPSSDTFTSIFFLYNTYQIFMSSNHSLFLIISNKMPFRERLATSAFESSCTSSLYPDHHHTLVSSRSAFCSLPISSNKILKWCILRFQDSMVLNIFTVSPSMFLREILFFFFISWRLITLQYCSGLCHSLINLVINCGSGGVRSAVTTSGLVQTATSAVHHCFCTISIVVNRVKKKKS